jgi:hypothetical protein
MMAKNVCWKDVMQEVLPGGIALPSRPPSASLLFYCAQFADGQFVILKVRFTLCKTLLPSLESLAAV